MKDRSDYAAHTLTGDWGGSRTVVFKEGMAFEAAYKVDMLRNLRGGGSAGDASMCNLDLKMRADQEKVWGWEGTTAYFHVIDDRGAGINARHLGSLLGASNIEVPVPTTRLFHAWVQKTFLEEQCSLLAGLYPIDSEFSVMDSAGVLLHPAYGASADLALTRGPSIFNNSAFGVRVKWQSPQRTWYAMGTWRYSNRVDDQFDMNGAGGNIHRLSWGGCLLAERTLFGLGTEPGRHLSGFARYAFTDGNSTPIRAQLNLGVSMRGPLAGRSGDVLALAWTQARLAAKFRAAQWRDSGVASTRHETAIELTYRAAFTPWLSIQPNLQWIRHPGGIADLRTAHMAGFRLELQL